MQKQGMDLVFPKVLSSVRPPHADSTISAESVLLEEVGKEYFSMNLVVRQCIVMVQWAVEEIPLSWSGALGSHPPSYFPVLQALPVGSGSKSHPLSSTNSCTKQHLAFQNSLQFVIVRLLLSLGRNTDLVG